MSEHLAGVRAPEHCWSWHALRLEASTEVPPRQRADSTRATADVSIATPVGVQLVCAAPPPTPGCACLACTVICHAAVS